MEPPAIVTIEGDDLQSAFGKIATSDQPFDRQFREFVKDVHGVDLAKDPPPDVQPGQRHTFLAQASAPSTP